MEHMITDERITFDGVEYVMIDDAFLTQEGAPAEVLYVWWCLRSGDTPDENGAVRLYEACYLIPDLDEDDPRQVEDVIDWAAPYDVRESKGYYSYYIGIGRVC